MRDNNTGQPGSPGGGDFVPADGAVLTATYRHGWQYRARWAGGFCDGGLYPGQTGVGSRVMAGDGMKIVKGEIMGSQGKVQ